MCPVMFTHYCSTSGIRRVTLVTNPVDNKSWMKKRPDCDNDKRNIYVVICDIGIP